MQPNQEMLTIERRKSRSVNNRKVKAEKHKREEFTTGKSLQSGSGDREMFTLESGNRRVQTNTNSKSRWANDGAMQLQAR